MRSDGFSRHRRRMGYMDLVELAPGMGPAGGFGDAACVVEMPEAGIGVSLESSSIVLQVLPGMFSLAIG